MLIAPGTPLICLREHDIVPEGFRKTVGALYICEALGPFQMDFGPEVICPADGCGPVALALKDFPRVRGALLAHCPNDFRPLNDGDTSLVQDAESYDDVLKKGPEIKKPTRVLV